MLTYLLDVNVLIALFDPQHIHHTLAHGWFAKLGKNCWATCPITENGLVRIVNSPSYPHRQASINLTVTMLEQAKNARPDKHVFWLDDISLTDKEIFKREFMVGHKTITDVYLMGLCKKHNGKFATFDTRTSIDFIKGVSQDLLEVL